MTRPEIPIDWNRVDKLLEAGCLGTEVAAVVGIHYNTFYNKVVEKYNIGFSEYSAQKKAKGEAALREVQYDKALGISKKGDNSMLIWLGKQRLGQRESVSEFSVSEDSLKPLAAVMGQMSSLQDARKRVAISDKAAEKSE